MKRCRWYNGRYHRYVVVIWGGRGRNSRSSFSNIVRVAQNDKDRSVGARLDRYLRRSCSLAPDTGTNVLSCLYNFKTVDFGLIPKYIGSTLRAPLIYYETNNFARVISRPAVISTLIKSDYVVVFSSERDYFTNRW